MPKIMARYPKRKSIGRRGSIIFGSFRGPGTYPYQQPHIAPDSWYSGTRRIVAKAPLSISWICIVLLRNWHIMEQGPRSSEDSKPLDHESTNSLGQLQESVSWGPIEKKPFEEQPLQGRSYVRAPKDHINMRMLQKTISGISLHCALEPEFKVLMFIWAFGIRYMCQENVTSRVIRPLRIAILRDPRIPTP